MMSLLVVSGMTLIVISGMFMNKVKVEPGIKMMLAGMLMTISSALFWFNQNSALNVWHWCIDWCNNYLIYRITSKQNCFI